MSPLLSFFLTWLLQFTAASAFLLTLVHLVARRYRQRHAAPVMVQKSGGLRKGR